MTDLSHGLRISREALEAAEKRAAAAQQRATAAEEKLERELRAVRQVFGEKESLGRQVAALEQKRAEAERACAALKDALVWCSGSPDFGAGGQAHDGWLRVCEPLLGPTPIGSGWLSPEEHAEVRSRADQWDQRRGPMKVASFMLGQATAALREGALGDVAELLEIARQNVLSALSPDVAGSGWLSPEQGAEARDRETKLARAMRDGHHALSTLIGICRLRDVPKEITDAAEPGLEAMRSTLQALGLCEITAEFFNRALAAHPTEEA